MPAMKKVICRSFHVISLKSILFTGTVFARFVARALIFFNQTHYRALIQTGPYSSTAACYFQSKIMHKNYR